MTTDINYTEKLYISVGNKGIIVSVMLVLSLIFNIAALLSPFYTVKMFMSDPYTCSLAGSVILMWNHHLLLIALLILSFSIIFPFFKLSMLFYTWFFCRDKERQQKNITLVGPLGKWSMLDIFMTVILLVMTNDQFLITSSLKIGVYFFLTAIFLSMMSALVIEAKIFSESIKFVSTKRHFLDNFWDINISRRIAIFILIIVALITLFMAINTPIIQINDFFFADNEFSILTSLITLWNQSLVLMGFVFLTLLICPLLHIICLFLIWGIFKLNHKVNHKIERLLHVISMFNMLDVFCLALIIFISNGSELVATKEKDGLYILFVFLFCLYLIPILIQGTHKNYLEFIKKIASQAQSRISQ